MSEKRIIAKPLIASLNKMDFWYWCRQFIDLSLDCAYACSYCNTRKRPFLSGIEFLPGLPANSLPRPPGLTAGSLPAGKEVIGLGLLSDIYQPGEGNIEIAGDILRKLASGGYQVSILTKSDSILNHIHLLKGLAVRDAVRATFTILTLDESISEQLEGSAPSPAQRLNAVSRLSEEGVPAGIAVTPVIPCVNDDEDGLERLIKAAKEHGARWVLFSGFNPVQSFLDDPQWQKTAALHKDGEALRERYLRIKKFIVRLLSRENLPMRIPRITLHPAHPGASARLATECLFNISYFYELLECEVESARYRRAANEIDSLKTPLKTIFAQKKLGNIKGVNPEIEAVIEEMLLHGRSNRYDEIYGALCRKAAEEECYAVCPSE